MKPRLISSSNVLVLLIFVLTAAMPSARSQQSTHPPSRPAKPRISLSGKAQTKDGTPLAGARVELIPTGSAGDAKGARFSTITLPDGTFRADLPWAGDYIFGVSLGILSCHGRIQPPYWQRGDRLSFTPGEQKAGVVYEVEGGGVLQGVLQNQSGKPVANGDVTLRQRVRVGEKAYRQFDVGSVQADNSGHYGFCNVPEAAYFVSSQGTLRMFGEKKAVEPLAMDYVQTFYPNAMDEDAAQPVSILAGGVKKLDLLLREAPTHHLRGHVVFPSGKTLQQPFVILGHVNAGSSTYIGYHVAIDSSGNFDLAGIPPGKYKLTAVADSGERELRKVPVETEIKKEWGGTEQVEVKDSDVVTKGLTLAPNGRVSGQLWDTHGDKFRFGNVILTIVTEDGRTLRRASEDGREIPWDAAEIESDGHFVLHELPPGKYRIGWLGQLSIRRPPTDAAAIYLSGATIAGRDALRDGFEVKPGEETRDASIILAQGTGSVKAKVRGPSGKPVPGVLVLLVPVEETEMQWHRYFSACSYPTEYVYFQGVPPGDYRVYAMEAPPVTHYFLPWSCGAFEKPNPDDLRIYEKDSTLIHIVSENTAEFDLRLIRAQ